MRRGASENLGHRPGTGAGDKAPALLSVCTLGVLFTGVPPFFHCGDGTLDDAGNILLLDWQPDACIDLSDAVAMLFFFFSGGPAHPLAVPGAETDGCVAIPGCAANASCP